MNLFRRPGMARKTPYFYCITDPAAIVIVLAKKSFGAAFVLFTWIQGPDAEEVGRVRIHRYFDLPARRDVECPAGVKRV